MDMMKNTSGPVIKKETKNRISVDYEGKLSFKERMKKMQGMYGNPYGAPFNDVDKKQSTTGEPFGEFTSDNGKNDEPFSEFDKKDE